MRILADVNQKGGPGKTTTSMLIADEFHQRARIVRVVDTDPQSSAQKWETRTVDGYPAIPFPVDHLIGLDAPRFAAALAKRASDADLIVIDTPPNLQSLELYAALFIADLVIVPFVPDAAHVDALEEVLSLFEKVSRDRMKINAGPVNARLLINRHDKRRQGEVIIAESAEQMVPFPKFKTSLGNRAAFQNAWNYRTTLSAVANGNTPARQEIAALVDEIEEFFNAQA